VHPVGKETRDTQPPDDFPGDEDLFDGDPGEDESLPDGPLNRFPDRRHLLPALALLVLFYAASALHGNHPLGQKLWVSGSAVFGSGEYWRVFTALFTHQDMVHLLSNAFMFIVFGWALKAYYGWMIFPLASLALGALTNYLTVLVYPQHIRLLGASGMVYAMAALWLVFYARHDVSHYPPVRLFRALGFVMVMLLPSTLEPNVSYLAHGIGFLAGLLAGLALMFFVAPREPV